MANRKILLPYNFTPIDQKAVNFVIEMFVQFKDVEITLFHAYTEAPAIETTETSTGRLKSGLHYLSQKILDQEVELDRVKQKLIRGGFAENMLQSIFKARRRDIAGEIMKLASENQYAAIVLSRGHSRATRFLTGSVANKIVRSLRGTTLCIVS